MPLCLCVVWVYWVGAELVGGGIVTELEGGGGWEDGSLTMAKHPHQPINFEVVVVAPIFVNEEQNKEVIQSIKSI